MLDRKLAPEFQTLDKIAMVQTVKHVLENGVELYSLNAGTQEVIKIEFLFTAGERYQTAPLVASTVNNLINEGTDKHSSEEIAGIIDYYGAFFQTETGKDSSSVVLYTLEKHLKKVLPVVKEILTEAAFPENELQTFIQNSKQKYLVDNQKVSSIARKYFLNMLYGDKNYYGYTVQLEDFDKLEDTSRLKDFYRDYYASNRCTIIAAGMVTDEVIDLLSSVFGSNWKRSESFLVDTMRILDPLEKQKVIEKPDAIQSAIRIGRNLFNKTHEDYMSMQVVNTILGGYFGSRLMANIREDKGYTYGIGSGLVSLQKAGYFFISTEVGVDVCQKAINEIYFELKRLREDLVSEAELNLVKNYMTGVFLKNTDGPFALSERFKGIFEYGLGYEFYDRYLNTIKTITPKQIKNIANKYLQQEDLLELVVGKK
ncbi:MAG: insulinase family protein [Bacteroidetes bacterium]|nr:insulinase family protein [Bacteroidota bacterium]HET6243374.1 pitrilysin family protein [Bacteroidia bacterium]